MNYDVLILYDQTVCDLSKKGVGVGLIFLFGGSKIRRGDCGAERAKRTSSRAKPEYIRLGDLGERRKLPQRGPGRSPGRYWFGAIQSKIFYWKWIEWIE